MSVRAGLYRAVERAFLDAGIPWSDCYYEDRGDGLFVLAPIGIPKCLFVESLPLSFVKELRRHNAAHPDEARIRLRMALHAGEITHDDHGVAGAALNFAFRLSDAPPLKDALARSPGLLALITSAWFFEEVVRHSPVSEPGSYRQVLVGVKETSTAGWICLPDHPYPAPSLMIEPSEPVAHQLPAYTPHFVGRRTELAYLTAQLDTVSHTTAIVAVNGPAGVGKTALAVHWARQIQDRFPDGQLYVNLRGFDATGTPVQPADAIRGFLDAFPLSPEQIPAGFEAQAALYRSLLANRRVFVVLDNARDAEQVRPLLPGSPTCVVVITSRDQLVDLVTWEGARPVNLDAFDLADAIALLGRRIGQHRLDADPEAVIHLLDRCARLPLAVAIVAARLELNPRLSIRMLADELAGESTRLEVLDELRTVVAWSYQHLDPAAARMFRLLGLHPGGEASAAAAASLAGVPLEQARTTLGELTQAHLFLEVEPGRFAFHDLLRAYAMARTATADTGAARRAATHRLLDHFLHTSFAAGEFILAPYQDIYPDQPPQPGVTVGTIQNYQHAKSWFQAEHQNLLRAIEHAAQQEFDVHAWQLAWALSAFLEWQGHWHDLLNLRGHLLTVVDRIGDDFARGRVHLMLGWMCGRIGRPAQARHHADLSLKVCRKIGDGLGQAGSHFVLAVAFGLSQDEQAALDHVQHALDFFHGMGDLSWQSRTHRLYAWVHGQCGNHSDALKHCEQALQLLRLIGGCHYEVATLENLLAWTQHRLGDHDEAIVHYGNAIAMYQELTDHYNEAEVFRRMGDTLLAAGRVVEARANWLRAMDIVDRFDLPNVERLRQRLTKRFNQIPAPTD